MEQITNSVVEVVLYQHKIGRLDYAVPPQLQPLIQPGMIVTAPLRRQSRRGVVFTVKNFSSFSPLLAINALHSEEVQLPPSCLELIDFAAAYYHISLGEMLNAALPALLKPQPLRFFNNPNADSPPPTLSLRLKNLLHYAATRSSRGLTLLGACRALAPLRREQIRPLLQHALAKHWLVTQPPPVKSRRRRQPPVGQSNLTEKINFTAETSSTAQQHAFLPIQQALANKLFACFLLHGITGSGKTHVYLQAIKATLAQQRCALVLVPEIALTPQLLAQFTAQFGEKVAVFHSGLSLKERHWHYTQVATGAAQIALGARSALFLPISRLGLIIVDEEHEASFKQEEAPTYHARDLAVFRAKKEQAVVVLGSATPSLESYHNCQIGRYQPLTLSQRIYQRPLPVIECVDMKQHSQLNQILSAPLVTTMQTTLAQGNQVILLLNRRGFAPYMFCSDCGKSFRCSDCDVALTFYQQRQVLLCHYCGFGCSAPKHCRVCHSAVLRWSGVGTEQLEQEVQRLFSQYTIVRLDRDVCRNQYRLHTTLSRFRSGKAQIMVGTQMVAKGHDFPNVTLVGVVNADSTLNMPDFRAAERTFQLITQVAGRAGRGEKLGLVIVQAYEVDHYSLRYAQNHDFKGFAAAELHYRRELNYPPYTYLCLLRFEGVCSQHVLASAQKQTQAMMSSLAVKVIGPVAAPLARLRGQYRFQTLLKSTSRSLLKNALAQLPAVQASQQIRRIIDVDPIQML